MKKFVLVLFYMFFSFCLLSCSDYSKNGEEMEIEFVEISDSVIRHREVEFHVDLKEFGYNYEKRKIANKADAKLLGMEIIDTLHNAGHMCNYELLSIVYSQNTNEWRFGYSQPFESSNEYIFFNDFLYVAIDGNSGNIIMSWFEEG